MKLTIDTTVDDAQAARDAIDFLTQRYKLADVITSTSLGDIQFHGRAERPADVKVDEIVDKLAVRVEVVPPLPATPGAPERDSAGVPWDERVHSGGRTKMKDGSWTRRRGVHDVEYARVLTEIMGAPSPAVQADQAGAAIPPLPPLSVVPQPPAATLPPPIPATVGGAAPALTWQAVCGVLNENVITGKVTPDQLNAKAKEFGVEPFALIGQRPDLYAPIHAWLSSF